jgi:hypothetical protein
MTISKLGVFSFLAITSAVIMPPRGIPNTIIFLLLLPRCFDSPDARISAEYILFLNVI